MTTSRYGSLFLGKTPTASGVPAATNVACAPPAPKAGNNGYTLLLVDDEPNVLNALRRVFREEKYRIETAANGEEALRILAAQKVHLLISDYKMPGMDGAELLKRVKGLHPETIRIMLTGHADTGAVMGAVNEGAIYKFILKPWNDEDLRVTVGLALEQYDLIERNKWLAQDNTRKAKEIKTLSKLSVTNRSQIAIMLHKRGLLNEKQLQELYKRQQALKEPMLKLILDRGWVTEQAIRDILRKDLMVEEVALAEFRVDEAVAEILPRSFCEKQWVVPLKIENQRLLLAVADPMDLGLIEDLRFITGFSIQPVMAEVAAIEKKLAEVYQTDTANFEEMETLVAAVDPFETIEIVLEDEDNVALEELLAKTEEPPAIRLVNAVILEAVRLGVSDIHIQPRAKSVVVRYRIDGVLHDKIHIPHHFHGALVSRIKVMAEMDIAERRRPQDGRITVKTPLRIVDLRISTLPTLNGEKVVMRILDRNASIFRIEDLGFSEGDREKVQHVVSKPQGIILATGPTGSGKTTTLYSLLQHDATPTKNYLTIEEPVEFYLDMAGQVNVREKVGLTFPQVLRAILRQDPDVILLGEIRDFETAEVAFHAALTGHLVYSTLHTNSALATVGRLLDLGLKPYVIAAALEGIIAQRLVRRICEHCREADAAPKAARLLGPLFDPSHTQFFKGKGCHRCANTGYRGRLALYEVLIPDDQLRHLIASGASLLDLSHDAEALGHRTLREDAREKLAAGLTACEEVLRVLGPFEPPQRAARRPSAAAAGVRSGQAH